jgi:hypothetical protein
MLGKQAKVLGLGDVADLLAFADCSRHPLRNRVMVLLSAKAGLRAGEIANLTWDMVLDASGGRLRLCDKFDSSSSNQPPPPRESDDPIFCSRQFHCQGSERCRAFSPYSQGFLGTTTPRTV